MDAIQQLRSSWARTEAGINTETIPNERIAALESNYGILLPDDFREFLSLSSPVGEAIDNEMVNWWSFDQIKNIPDEFSHPLNPVIADGGRKYLIFADYCLWCWAWAISCADDGSRGQVAIIAGNPHDRIVANSFSDFVQRYVNGPQLVM